MNLAFEKIKQVEFSARVVSKLLVFSIRISQALSFSLGFIYEVATYFSSRMYRVYPGLRPGSKACSEHMNEWQYK